MASLKGSRIIGTGMYVPPNKVTNHDLEKIMETSDEWIVQRSGIRERYHAAADVCTSDLGTEAALRALKAANLKPSAIDLIITATLSPDHHFPGLGVKIQHKLGLETTPAMDIRNQCSGFIYSLSTAHAFLAAGMYQKIMVIGAEIHSKLVNLSTPGRDVSVLFGDGAGAIILEAANDSTRGIQDCLLYSQGEFANKLWMERPGTTESRFILPEDLENGRQFPFMDGRYVFKHATKRLEEAVTQIVSNNQLSIDQVDHYLFHQANIRINEHVGKSLGIDPAKIHNNIDRYGNCSAASLPILLDECIRQETIKPGDLICLGAFGAGFTWATCLLRL